MSEEVVKVRFLGFLLSLSALVFLLAAPVYSLERTRALMPSPAITLELQDPASSLSLGASDPSSTIDETHSRSKTKALALSALLPGAGQYYAGKKGRAQFFFLTEAAIWTGFLVFEVQGYLRKDSYVEYAELTAGVDAQGKSDEFYRALGQYGRSDPGPGSYNEDIRREARALYPDDRQKQEEYLRENGYFGDDAWEWRSVDDQARYRSLRKKSQLSFNRATYMLGLAVANRVLAAMDAARSVAKSGESPGESHGFRFEMRPDPESPSSVMLCVSKSF